MPAIIAIAIRAKPPAPEGITIVKSHSENVKLRRYQLKPKSSPLDWSPKSYTSKNREKIGKYKAKK